MSSSSVLELQEIGERRKTARKASQANSVSRLGQLQFFITRLRKETLPGRNPWRARHDVDAALLGWLKATLPVDLVE